MSIVFVLNLNFIDIVFVLNLNFIDIVIVLNSRGCWFTGVNWWDLDSLGQLWFAAENKIGGKYDNWECTNLLWMDNWPRSKSNGRGKIILGAECQVFGHLFSGHFGENTMSTDLSLQVILVGLEVTDPP